MTSPSIGVSPIVVSTDTPSRIAAALQTGGMLLLGSMHDDAFLTSSFVKGKGRRLPLYLGHGTDDTVFDWQGEADFFRKIKAAAPDYPIRFALFQTGSHGTPIRMTDWRMQLNWMLGLKGKQPG